MSTKNDGVGTEMPTQDRELTALADLLEEIGDEAGQAWLRNGAGDEAAFAECTKRAEVVTKAIVGLRAMSLHGASAKADAARVRGAMVLLPRELVDAFANDMARDVVRLRGREVAGHA